MKILLIALISLWLIPLSADQIAENFYPDLEAKIDKDSLRCDTIIEGADYKARAIFELNPIGNEIFVKPTTMIKDLDDVDSMVYTCALIDRFLQKAEKSNGMLALNVRFGSFLERHKEKIAKVSFYEMGISMVEVCIVSVVETIEIEFPKIDPSYFGKRLIFTKKSTPRHLAYAPVKNCH